MVVSVLSVLAGAVLLAAAGLKAVDPLGSQVALGTYGIRGRAAAGAWAALVAAELALGAGLLVAAPGAAPAAAALLAAFAAAQVAALAAGRGGAPCGCAGGRGRLSWAATARTAALGAAAALSAAAELLPLAAAVGATAALALVLWGRRGAEPGGALDVAGEGPPLGEPAPFTAPAGVVLFTSAGCRLCRRVRAGLLERGIAFGELDERRDADAWRDARVPGSPYVVVVDGEGVVRAKGTVNTPRQVASLLGAPDAHSRRGFLARAAGAAAALTAGPAVGALVAPGDAEAFHFCGHIYTTDSCPHPTGLPRIDSRGFPLRASDGHRVDDLGRLVDVRGNPVDEDGLPLVDADGRSLPAASRTRVCTATGHRFGIPVRTDGAWYRCCDGHVRKLVDCCSTHTRRINGDRALRGYCYGRRKVFCVMYFQTRVPC